MAKIYNSHSHITRQQAGKREGGIYENKNETYETMLNSEFEYEKMNNISKQEKQEWLEKFYNRMSKALYKWSIMPCAPIIDAHSINSYEYKQPISSSKIVYKDF